MSFFFMGRSGGLLVVGRNAVKLAKAQQRSRVAIAQLVRSPQTKTVLAAVTGATAEAVRRV